MEYLLKNIVIFEGQNKRGKYHWLQGELFNDKNIRMNSERRMYYSTSESECELYLNANVCTPNTELTTATVKAFDVNDQSLKEAMQPGGALEDYGDIRHLCAVRVTWPLTGVWAQIYKQDVVENNTVVHRKGDKRTTETGQVMEFRELSFYLASDIDPDTNERIYSQDPQQVANRILERGYVRITDVETPTVATAPQTPQAPAEEEQQQKTPEEIQAQIAALQAQLA